MTEHFPPYSDFNFVSLFTWHTPSAPISVAELHGNFVVQFSDYTTNASFLSFLGTHQVRDTIEELRTYGLRTRRDPHLHLVGERVIEHIPRDYSVQPDRDNDDYIMDAKDMTSFSGMPRKRIRYGRFVRTHGPLISCRQLDLSAATDRQAILALTRQWQITRGRSNKEVSREFSAIRRCVRYAIQLDVQGFGAFLDNQLIAFSLFELLPDHFALLHFAKTNTALPNISEYFNHRRAHHLASLGVQKINFEQDLGIEGLRRAKTAYHPIDFLRKYTITGQP